MFFELLLVAVVCYAAHCLRPDPNSFPKFHDGLARSRGRQPTGLFGKLLGGLHPSSHFDYTDVLVGWLAHVQETGEVFLGIFRVWLSLPTNQQRRSGEATEALELGRMAPRSDAVIQEAHQYKAEGKYEKAAQLYEKGAVANDKNGDPFAYAELLDEAARCWKQAGNDRSYFTIMEKAVAGFQKRNRMGKAARLLDKAAQHCVALAAREDTSTSQLQQAAKYYGRAADLYGMEDDGRAESLRVERLHIIARLGQLEEASQGFETTALQIVARDPILINQSQRLLFMALLCVADDAPRYCRWVADLTQQYSWFAHSREGKLAVLLGEALALLREQEVDAMLEKLERAKGMVASLPLWAEAHWSAILSQIVQGRDDIR